MMRRIALVLNAIVTLFFIGFLTYTFVARQHLDGLARRFVTEKTIQYAAPVVNLAEQGLKEPLIRRLVPARILAAIQQEIDQYHDAPAAFIADLTRQAKGAIEKPGKPNPLLVQVTAIKEKIRNFYDDTLNALVEDLRIFSICNLVAAAMALGLAWWSREPVHQSIIWFSFLMCATVIYCSAIYVDDLTFFRILFRTHMGWWYAAFLCVILLAIYLDYGHWGQPPSQSATRPGAAAATTVPQSSPPFR